MWRVGLRGAVAGAGSVWATAAVHGEKKRGGAQFTGHDRREQLDRMIYFCHYNLWMVLTYFFRFTNT
jgi:hypothetical protein